MQDPSRAMKGNGQGTLEGNQTSSRVQLFCRTYSWLVLNSQHPTHAAFPPTPYARHLAWCYLEQEEIELPPIGISVLELEVRVARDHDPHKISSWIGHGTAMSWAGLNKSPSG